MRGLARLRARLAGPARVSPQVAQELQRAGAVLLDVRTRAEFRAGHAPRARNVPLDQLVTRTRELPPGRPVVTICQSGGRSARAAALLSRQGRDVIDVRGGMLAWQRSGLPVDGARRSR